MYKVELFRGNCVGGKSPGVIVLEKISWGVIVQRAVVQGKLSLNHSLSTYFLRLFINCF